MIGVGVGLGVHVAVGGPAIVVEGGGNKDVPPDNKNDINSPNRSIPITLAMI